MSMDGHSEVVGVDLLASLQWVPDPTSERKKHDMHGSRGTALGNLLLILALI